MEEEIKNVEIMRLSSDLGIANPPTSGLRRRSRRRRRRSRRGRRRRTENEV